MEKFPSSHSQENQENRYATLKKQLFSGTLSFHEIKNTLLALDQETLSRDASLQNLQFLRDPEIIAYVAGQLQEVVAEYNSILSFTEFHVGQRIALNNQGEAIEHFEKALESAKLEDAPDEEWSAYIEGTLLYLKGEEIPKEIFAKIESQKNIAVLQRLNAGLQKRGAPSYVADYFQQEESE